MANGAVPSEAGSRSAYTRSVAPGSTSARPCRPGAPRRSARWTSSAGHVSGRAIRSWRTLGRPTVANSRRPTPTMPPLRRISSSFGVSGAGSYVPALRVVRETSRLGIEAELVAVPRIGDRLRTLHHVQPQVQRVASEDVAHVSPQHDDELETGLLGHALSGPPGSSRATIRWRSDRRQSRNVSPRWTRSRKSGMR